MIDNTGSTTHTHYRMYIMIADAHTHTQGNQKMLTSSIHKYFPANSAAK